MNIFYQTNLSSPAPLARATNEQLGRGFALGQEWGFDQGDLQDYDVGTAVDKILRWGNVVLLDSAQAPANQLSWVELAVS